MQTQWNELLAFCITSAIGLQEEPPIYGPLRLIDCMQRVICLGRQAGQFCDPAFSALEAYIEENKLTCMYDQAAFGNILQEIAFRLIDATKE